MTDRITTERTALITGASRGLGRALSRALARTGWQLIIDARGEDALAAVTAELPGQARAFAGDVRDSRHRAALIDAVEEAGGLDLLVNNASTLGAAPLPRLAAYPLKELEQAFQTNTIAPLALIQGLLPALTHRRGAVLGISSDAAVEAYEGWGGYGATKAAFDQISHVLSVEEPELAVWWVDPGEMGTEMLREAMPEEDLSETPPPESVVPALLKLIDGRLPSGRYTAGELLR
ncbi:SDR family oxidoreductase [Actinomadura sp. HBU206391]|uniref:SDR family oxidoreductase n=1 Tax=Actinomadura sp. HBU206391 TaxID=2731692 RepID=UPI001650C4E6|nr:SDR family oxidoreductase [Actinomadura sp. HBU206391]MBC6459565.1 SDR family oxidoreductase [Actinomadura sp. HBU206391]